MVLLSSLAGFFFYLRLVFLSSGCRSWLFALFYFLGWNFYFANLMFMGERGREGAACWGTLLQESRGRMEQRVALGEVGQLMVFGFMCLNFSEVIFYKIAYYTMSLYLVGRPEKGKANIEGRRVVFAKVLWRKTVVVIDDQGQMVLFDLITGNHLHVFQLVCDQRRIEFILKTSTFEEIVCIMTRRDVFLLDLAAVSVAFICQEKQIEAKMVKLFRGKLKQQIKCDQLMNKEVSIVKIDKLLNLKLTGKTKFSLIYYCGLLDVNNGSVLIYAEYTQQINLLLNISFSQIDRDIMLYNCYSKKMKAIALKSIEFLPLPINQDSQYIMRQVNVSHLFNEISVLRVIKLNRDLVTLFCVNTFGDKSQSVMIIYNIREKYVRNYLTIDGTMISKEWIYLKEGYEWYDCKGLASFDVIEYQGNRSRLFQLTPESYVQKPDEDLQGRIISSDSYYLISSNKNILFCYPKIPKQQIYTFILNYLLPNQSEFISIVVSLL